LTGKPSNVNEDIQLYNQKLWRELKLKTPVEPTEDMLRYIIDNSFILEDWHKDILETLRVEGQYYWPMIKTKFLNEGFATFTHQKIMNRLFEKELLNSSEHAQYNYSNSLVKAHTPFQMNPYYIGCAMFEDIENRWDKGRYGREWDDCNNINEKEAWDKKEGKGMERCLEIVRSFQDWFFMQEFLTVDLINDLNLYVYQKKEEIGHTDYVITKHQASEIRDAIVNSFAHSGIPKIEIVNGNFKDRGELKMMHRYGGADLDKKFAEETMKHIFNLWGKAVNLITKIGGKKEIAYVVDRTGGGNSGMNDYNQTSVRMEEID